jgi:hypothetical protein
MKAYEILKMYAKRCNIEQYGTINDFRADCRTLLGDYVLFSITTESIGDGLLNELCKILNVSK